MHLMEWARCIVCPSPNKLAKLEKQDKIKKPPSCGLKRIGNHRDWVVQVQSLRVCVLTHSDSRG